MHPVKTAYRQNQLKLLTISLKFLGLFALNDSFAVGGRNFAPIIKPNSAPFFTKKPVVYNIQKKTIDLPLLFPELLYTSAICKAPVFLCFF